MDPQRQHERGAACTRTTSSSTARTRRMTCTAVMPSVSLQGKGARANVGVNAAMEMNSRSGGGTGNFNPFLNANGDVELIEDFFFTDVFARAGQTTTDPFRAASDTSLTENENTSTTYSYGITPSIRRRLGSFATFNASARWDQQFSANDDFDDSTQRLYNASLLSGDDFSRLSWGVTGEHRITEYENNAGGGDRQDDQYSNVRLPLGYRISRKWQLTSSVGREWQDYDAQSSDRDDDTWDVGVVWTPSPRTSLNVGYGDRYFDNAPRLDFSHRSKRVTLRASYDRTLTTTRDLRARELDFGPDNPFGLPFDPGTGQPIPVSENRGFLDSGSVIDERFDASVAVQGAAHDAHAARQPLRADAGRQHRRRHFRRCVPHLQPRPVRQAQPERWRHLAG
ncbi:MAG: TIGR03016 family PEP-CTERM system-associated outer membrane protein [Gammaproteobacteria bacterium]|nr:TIGR03016 family PEP-CTERM system-associated outer membrane protein [Gammaproteobacteria bacterium]